MYVTSRAADASWSAAVSIKSRRSTRKDVASAPTHSPCTTGTAAQPVPSSYSCSSQTIMRGDGAVSLRINSAECVMVWGVRSMSG